MSDNVKTTQLTQTMQNFSNPKQYFDILMSGIMYNGMIKFIESENEISIRKIGIIILLMSLDHVKEIVMESLVDLVKLTKTTLTTNTKNIINFITGNGIIKIASNIIKYILYILKQIFKPKNQIENYNNNVVDIKKNNVYVVNIPLNDTVIKMIYKYMELNNSKHDKKITYDNSLEIAAINEFKTKETWSDIKIYYNDIIISINKNITFNFIIKNRIKLLCSGDVESIPYDQIIYFSDLLPTSVIKNYVKTEVQYVLKLLKKQETDKDLIYHNTWDINKNFVVDDTKDIEHNVIMLIKYYCVNLDVITSYFEFLIYCKIIQSCSNSFTYRYLPDYIIAFIEKRNCLVIFDYVFNIPEKYNNIKKYFSTGKNIYTNVNLYTTNKIINKDVALDEFNTPKHNLYVKRIQEKEKINKSNKLNTLLNLSIIRLNEKDNEKTDEKYLYNEFITFLSSVEQDVQDKSAGSKVKVYNIKFVDVEHKNINNNYMLDNNYSDSEVEDGTKEKNEQTENKIKENNVKENNVKENKIKDNKVKDNKVKDKNVNNKKLNRKTFAMFAQKEPEKQIQLDFINENYKTFDTLYLRQEDKQKLIHAVKAFKENHSIFTTFELPYKLGIMLHGIPGTGKTTTIHTIATYLQKDIYYVSLKDDWTNEDLQKIFDYVISKCVPGGIIVFEDIDAMTKIVHKRTNDYIENVINETTTKILDTKKNKITLEYFLNLLQGLLTKEGTTFIATTNHLEKIDPAFYRAGRFDAVIELKLCDHFQINEMFKKFVGRPIDTEVLNKIPENKFTPSEIIQVLVKYIKDNTSDIEIMKPFII